MTSTASLHFGPEWMRKPARASPASPVPNGIGSNTLNGSNGVMNGATSGGPPPNALASTVVAPSSYSSLLASPMPADPVQDATHPFRYSRDQMLAVWKNGGGQGELGLEVERWPGIVREDVGEPLGLSELSADEKKACRSASFCAPDCSPSQALAFSMPYNSDPPLRRRGDSYSSQTPIISTAGGGLDRNKLASPIRTFSGGSGPGAAGPGASVGIGLPTRRKKDENGQDIPVYRPRQLSLGTNGTPSNGPPPSPGGALPSPGGTGVTRSRLGGASFDGVMGDAWGGAVRRRVGEPRRTVDDKLEGSWRPSGDSRFREEITEEPSADLWDVPDAHEAMPPISNSTGDAGSMDGDGSVHPQPAESGSLPHTPAPVNPATVSWCYKDPTGLVQGPFSATVMQSWYTGGYFTDDLLLKRIDVDQDFDPLQAYRLRVLSPGTVETLFISPIADKLSVAPPGLTGLGRISPPNQSIFGQPQQPPVQSQFGRHDSFPVGSPITGPSPSIANTSSISAYTSPSVASSGFGFPSAIGGPVHDIEKQRLEREHFLQTLREKELSNHNINGVNGFMGGLGSDGMQDQLLGGNVYGTNRQSAFSSGLTALGEPQNFGMPSQVPGYNPRQPFPSTIDTMFPTQSIGIGGMDGVYSPSTYQQTPNSIWPRTPHAGIVDPNAGFGATKMAPGGQSFNSNWNAISEPQNTIVMDGTSGFSNVSQTHSPWNHTINNIVEPIGQAPSPIGSVPIPDMVPQPLGVIGQQDIIRDSIAHVPVPESEPPVEVEAASHPLENEAIASVINGVDALSVAESVVEPSPAVSFQSSIIPESVPEPQEKPVTTKAKHSSKSSGQSSSAHSRPATASSAAVSREPSSGPANEPPASAVSPSSSAKQTAWTNFSVEEKTSSTISLRKIQENEAKRAAEAKKLERERERMSKAAALSAASPSSSVNSALPDTSASWGLPQVGRAPPTVATPISIPTPNAPSPIGAWATKKVATKKTMKEIQEEEEAKRRLEAQQAPQVKETTTATIAPATAKRAQLESTKAPAPVAPSGSGWSTIVAGKATKTAATAASTSSAAARPTGIAALPARPPAPTTLSTSAVPKQKAVPTPKPVEEIPPPSLDFIRWMRDALRGFSGGNVEEFMQMLLSFPLDPSPSVMEIIADSVYAGSATLDGRRFASEFVAKRKADAATAKTQAAQQAGAFAGNVSLAEVVKSQKKPNDDGEWTTKPAKPKKGKRGNN